MMRGIVGAGLLLVVVLGSAEAQRVERGFDPDTTQPIRRHAILRPAKWLTLAGAAGAAFYGVTSNRQADQKYEDLERVCQADPDRCRARLQNGAFADPELERQYQRVLELDDRAKLGLAAAEVAVGATVVLFLIDLPRNSRGKDIPYHPPRLQIGTDASQRLVLSYRLTFEP